MSVQVNRDGPVTTVTIDRPEARNAVDAATAAALADAFRAFEADDDAAVAILRRPSRECTGNFFIDDEVLAQEGVSDLSIYRYGDASEADLAVDLFLD